MRVSFKQELLSLTSNKVHVVRIFGRGHAWSKRNMQHALNPGIRLFFIVGSCLSDSNGIRNHNHLVRRRTLSQRVECSFTN